jgi:hypothetical protein
VTEDNDIMDTPQEAAARRVLLANPNWSGLSDEEKDRIATGELKLARINAALGRSFDEWVEIGQAIIDLQDAAKRRSNSTNTKGIRYNEAFKFLAPPHLREMDKSERGKTVKLCESAAQIRPWYFDDAVNQDSDRRRMQHPQTILAKFEAYQRRMRGPQPDDEPGEGKKKRPDEAQRRAGQAAQIDDAIHQLHDTADEVRDSAHQVRRALGQKDIELDLSDARGKLASWETLVALYGLYPLIDMFVVGLWKCAADDLAEYQFEELLELVSSKWDDDDAIDEVLAQYRSDRDAAAEEAGELTADEVEALAKIGEQHAAGTMWVGPKWRKANGISEELVTGLVNMGKLRRGAHQSVQRVDDGSADEEETEAEETDAQDAQARRDTETEIFETIYANPQWTVRGIARKLHYPESVVQAAMDRLQALRQQVEAHLQVEAGIRDYAKRHPADTPPIIAAALGCPEDVVRAALAAAPEPAE